MKELGKTLLYSLAISIPLSLAGVTMSMWLAHSDVMKPIAIILFAPFFAFATLESHFFHGLLSNFWFNCLALLSQAIGYFIVVAVVRAVLGRRVRSD
jgi:hypothetical protein